MASLQVRNKRYYIVFSRRVGEKLEQKKFSLRTKSKREAAKLRIEFEELYEKDEINPFGSWTPKTHFDKSRNASPAIITLSDFKALFLEQRKHVRQVTRDNYERHLNMLEKELGSTIPVTLITENDMRTFCFQSHLSVATQASYVTHYKVFFKWLEKLGAIKQDPMSGIKKPKVPRNVSQKILSEEQLHEVFKAHREDIREKRRLRQITTRSQFRIWFRPVASIAFYGGLRVSEVVKLTWDNVDLTRRQITLTGTKSGEERVIPIRKELLIRMKAWRKFDRFNGKGLVFPSETGFDAMQGMSKGNVSKVLRKYVDAAGLPKTVKFHGLRHSFGTENLRRGYDINEVSKLMGHNSLEVTKIYEHLTPNDLMNKMKKIENESDEQEKRLKELEEKERKLRELENQLRVKEKELLLKEESLRKKND